MTDPMTGQLKRGNGAAGRDTRSVTSLTAQQRRLGRRAVAGRAQGVEDCRLLLDMLDLLGPDHEEKAS